MLFGIKLIKDMYLIKGDQVDIHLKSGLMARGVVHESSSGIITLHKNPAIHSKSQGIVEFKQIFINADEICAYGVKQNSQS